MISSPLNSWLIFHISTPKNHIFRPFPLSPPLGLAGQEALCGGKTIQNNLAV